MPFRYQVRCLEWLREELAGIQGEPKAKLERVLKEIGAWDCLSAPARSASSGAKM